MKHFQFLFVLLSGCVNRWHTLPTVKAEDNAQHQWLTCVVCEYIYPDCSKNLLKHCLLHDSAEAAIGDLPSPVRLDFPDLSKQFKQAEKELLSAIGIDEDHLDIQERKIFKLCDLLANYLFLKAEDSFGNKTTFDAMQRSRHNADIYIEENEFDESTNEKSYKILGLKR